MSGDTRMFVCSFLDFVWLCAWVFAGAQKAQKKPPSVAEFFDEKCQFYASAKQRFGEPSKYFRCTHVTHAHIYDDFNDCT